MSDPTKQEVVRSILDGITKAQEDYRKAYMSDIASSYAPEYLMTVYIFQSILRLKDSYGNSYGLSLEESVPNLAVPSKGRRGRRPQWARDGGRCDLSLSDIEGEPIAAIEVKKDCWKYWEDLLRLNYLVSQGLKFGVFASCCFEEGNGNTFEEAKARLKETIELLHKEVPQYFKTLGSDCCIKIETGTVQRLVLSDEPPNGDEVKAWCPVCFVISCDRHG